MDFNSNRILLGLLPFWTPLVPPTGIATLKAFLEKHGFLVRTVDANGEESFKNLYNKYYDMLRDIVPENNRGNFYNVGHHVLQNHMMAHFHFHYHHHDKNTQDYIQLVRDLVYYTYFSRAADKQVMALDRIVAGIYLTLEKYLVGLVEEEKPGTIGFTVYFHTLASSVFAYRLIKERYPSIQTVMGGGIFSDQFASGSPDYEFFLEKTKDYIDKIIIGEGLMLLLQLLRGELPPCQRVFSLKALGAKPLDFSLVDLPDLADYNLTHYPYIAATGSTSCPNECSFCTGTVFAGKFREKDPTLTVKEMTQLYRTYGKRLFFMTDSLLNPIITNFSHELIKNKRINDVSLYFDGYFRVDDAACFIENTLMWRKAGFYRARLGVESGSQHVLDMIGKNITIEQTKAVLAALAYAGIKTTAYIVIGHPGETEDDFKRTLDFVEEFKDDIYEVECNPFAYYFTGQPHSLQWKNKQTLLYPEHYRDFLISHTWIVDDQPCREEIYRRLFRITEHCDKLGIPNPYSMNDIYNADERWQKLHQHAVPRMVDLISPQKQTTPPDETNKEVVLAQQVELEDAEFEF